MQFSLLALLLVPALAAPALAGPQEEAEFLASINALRSANGLGPLAPDEDLAVVARGWAQNLARTGSLSHNPALAAQAPTGWSSIGENVGYGTSVAEIQADFVADPPHLANLLDPSFDRVGLGVVESGGTLWAVQDFTGSGGAPLEPVLAVGDEPASDDASSELSSDDPSGLDRADGEPNDDGGDGGGDGGDEDDD